MKTLLTLVVIAICICDVSAGVTVHWRSKAGRIADDTRTNTHLRRVTRRGGAEARENIQIQDGFQELEAEHHYEGRDMRERNTLAAIQLISGSSNSSETGPSSWTRQHLHINLTTYCFIVIDPETYELALAKLHLAHTRGCTQFEVISNVNERDGLKMMKLIEGNMKVSNGGPFNTALNNPIFSQVWRGLVHMEEMFDWYVKIDPDSVVDVNLLRTRLERINEQMPLLVYGGEHPNGGVKGPIEILSRSAILKMREGVERCVSKFEHLDIGEDWYLDKCCHELGIDKHWESNLLHENNHDCDPSAIVKHPFKDPEKWEECESATVTAN